MKVYWGECWHCGYPVDPNDEFELLVVNDGGIVEEPVELEQDGVYEACHTACTQDIVETLVTNKEPK